MFLSKLKYLKKQKLIKNQKSGRNNSGRITVRRRGGGHKRSIRIINWTGELKNSLLIGVSYNPIKSGMLFQFINKESGEIFYQPATSKFSLLEGLNLNDSSNSDHFREPLSNFNIGDFCSHIGSSKINYIKASGSVGKVLQRYTWIKNYMLIVLPSGEQKLFLKTQSAVKGANLGNTKLFEKLKMAGRSRWLSKRPSVRGVAMNPIDHPHGGGEGKTSGGRPSVSKWGRLTKNVKTRKTKRALWQIFSRKKK